jgi:hypothetical protein
MTSADSLVTDPNRDQFSCRIFPAHIPPVADPRDGSPAEPRTTTRHCLLRDDLRMSLFLTRAWGDALCND